MTWTWPGPGEPPGFAAAAMAEPAGAAFRVEAAALATGLTSALRRAGLPGSPDRAAWLAQALRLIPPAARDRLYWTCRVVLVSTREQLPVFDAVFASIFGGGTSSVPGTVPEPAEHRGDSSRVPETGSQAPLRAAAAGHRPGPLAPGTDGAEPRHGRDAVLVMASDEERLHAASFADLTPEELEQILRLVRRIVLATPTRRSRRTRQWPHGSARLDIRRTVRAARRTGADAARLVYARRRLRARQLVLLCDVSGSMEPYARVFLSLLQGAVAGAHAEVFVFATQLHRLTRQLAVRDPDQALARATAGAPDWAGGTRLAQSLQRFIDEHGRRGLARGAVVVIFSDGWAQDPPELVQAQMARLRRLAYRIVWVNPRSAAPGYQPLAGGMAAALPYCDAFVSGHSYTALAEVAAAIRAGQPA